MIVGVVSDTHLPRFGRELPPALVRGLRKAGVDVIAHCGDLTEPIAIELLEKIAPVIAVAGNNDGKQLHKELGERKIIEADEARIGIVHGHAGKGRSTADRAYNAFADDTVDAILFGHSHIPYRARRDGVLMFNPGSPTDKRLNPMYSYGIVRVEGKTVRASHRFYLSKR
ncbi:MAG: metallophosphoesterase family protein [Candidatus Eremiobacteraeota bacterium]|nr:metallophosphoesterase family protein [Candidatus Eremiobacteraeota bacterium]